MYWQISEADLLSIINAAREIINSNPTSNDLEKAVYILCSAQDAYNERKERGEFN